MIGNINPGLISKPARGPVLGHPCFYGITGDYHNPITAIKGPYNNKIQNIQNGRLLASAVREHIAVYKIYFNPIYENITKYCLIMKQRYLAIFSSIGCFNIKLEFCDSGPQANTKFRPTDLLLLHVWISPKLKHSEHN